MTEAVIKSNRPRPAKVEQAVYEHPWAVRFCHWLNSVSLLVTAAQRLSDLCAFPSFRAKIPAEGFVATGLTSLRSVDGWAAACSGI